MSTSSQPWRSGTYNMSTPSNWEPRRRTNRAVPSLAPRRWAGRRGAERGAGALAAIRTRDSHPLYLSTSSTSSFWKFSKPRPPRHICIRKSSITAEGEVLWEQPDYRLPVEAAVRGTHQRLKSPSNVGPQSRYTFPILGKQPELVGYTP